MDSPYQDQNNELINLINILSFAEQNWMLERLIELMEKEEN